MEHVREGPAVEQVEHQADLIFGLEAIVEPAHKARREHLQRALLRVARLVTVLVLDELLVHCRVRGQG